MDNKNVSSSKWLKFSLGLLAVVMIWNTVQLWSMNSVVNKVDQYNLGVVDEMGKMVGNSKAYAADLNEIRQFLLLPQKNYNFDQENQEKTGSDEKSNSESSVALYAFLDQEVQEQKLAEKKAVVAPVLTSLYNDTNLKEKLKQSNLKYGDKGDFQVKFVDTLETLNGQKNELAGQALFNLVYAPEENVFKIQSALEEIKIADFDKAGFGEKVMAYLSANASKVREKKLAEKLNAQQQLAQSAQSKDAELKKKKNDFVASLKEKAFVDTLSSIGLKLADQPREENNKYIFDVVDSAQKVKFSLALEISSGMIKVIKNGQEINLENYLNQAEDGSKKKP